MSIGERQRRHLADKIITWGRRNAVYAALVPYAALLVFWLLGRLGKDATPVAMAAAFIACTVAIQLHELMKKVDVSATTLDEALSPDLLTMDDSIKDIFDNRQD